MDDLMLEDYLAAMGSEVKALGNGKIGGYLVLYGDPDKADLYGDFFTAETDFGVDFENTPDVEVRYHHGFDKTVGKRKIGSGVIGKDDIGIWIEAQLNLRDEYEKAVYQMAEAKKLGWSSSAASHLVERKSVGQAQQIISWPLVRQDATLTPTPADPRQIVEIKSLQLTRLELEAQPEDPATGSAEAVKAVSVTVHPREEIKMSDTQTPPASVLEAEIKGLREQVETLKGIVQSAPAIKEGGYATGQPEETEAQKHLKMFNQYIRTGHVLDELKATLVEGTAANGGYLVPEAYAMEIVRAIQVGSYLRAAGARVIQVSGNNKYNVPTLTNSGAAVLTAESAAFDQAEPTLGEVELVPYKYTALSKTSEELLADSRFPVETILSQDAAYRFIQAENTAFTTGTGSGQPQGVVVGSSLGKTTASASAITADEIIDLYHSLGFQYRANAKWMMNDSTLALVRKLKDTTNQYLWQPGLAAGQPDTILGRPVIINNSMATVATGQKTILFGDFSYFWIVEWDGMAMQRLNELYAANGHVGFRWFKRFDSKVMLSAAIKHLIQA